MAHASVLARITLGLALVGLASCDKQTPPTTDASEAPAGDLAATPSDPSPGDSGMDDMEEDSEDLSDEGGAEEPAASDASAGPDGNEPEPPATADGGADPGATASAPAQDEDALPKAKYTKVDKSCGKDPGVGQKLKGFTLKTPDGKKVTNRSYGKRVLLVNFWGTWCKPCLKELPEFDRLYRRYRKHGLTLVAIATDDDPEPVKAYLSKSKLRAKVAIGGEDYAAKYGSPKFPFTFVVDPSGTIKSSYRGYEPKCMGKLEADIREELEKRKK